MRFSPTFGYTKAPAQCRFLASRPPAEACLLGTVPGGGTCGRAHTIRVARLRGVVRRLPGGQSPNNMFLVELLFGLLVLLSSPVAALSVGRLVRSGTSGPPRPTRSTGTTNAPTTNTRRTASGVRVFRCDHPPPTSSGREIPSPSPEDAPETVLIVPGDPELRIPIVTFNPAVDKKISASLVGPRHSWEAAALQRFRNAVEVAQVFIRKGGQLCDCSPPT